MAQEAKEGLKEAGLSNVLLGGNYVSGVALGKCVEYAFTFADEVVSTLDRQSVPSSN
jgi:protoporphyrinogen/coproporphyrinogen III oxidase